jgi:hypothetical protein
MNCGFAQFLGESVPLNSQENADKFAGSLIFGVGPSLQNPEKTAEKSEFQKFWASPSFKIPRNRREFFGWARP